ncbi:hypothetical protein R3P38DRAFT_3311654 [Favolaschia claudopus]|uniref:Uncharacterized protein n=1 Tax=Favolaschia claudopus TaxID=2862362 RepID=A0AAW0CBF2_9AGAR
MSPTLLAGNAQPLLTAMVAGQSSQPPPTPTTLPPASTHPSVAQSQPPAASAPATSVPVIQPYQSLRTAPSSLPVQLPPLPQPASSSSASLTSVVNQARLSHAASSLPRQPALPRRRPRGNATAPPSLPRVPDIASCMTTSGNLSTIRTMNVIYPPQEDESEADLYLMRFLWESFCRVMGTLGLIVLQNSDTTTSLIDHIQNIAQELRSRDTAHENQPPAPLYVVNRGVPRPSDNQVRLRRTPLRATATLGELAANRVQYAVPGLCIVNFEGQNYLVLHYVMRQSALTASLSLGESQSPYPHADGESSCGESDSEDDLGLEVDDDDDEFENSFQSPPPTQPGTRVLRSIAITGGLGRSHAPLPAPTVPSVPAFPSRLWIAPFMPQRNDQLSATMFSSDIYQAATSGTAPRSVIYRANSVSEAADQLLATVAQCVDDGDFTAVLSDDQSALITDPDTGRVVSSGEGIMREILYAAFQKTLSTSEQWLTSRVDDNLSLLFVRSSGFGAFSSGPRQKMIGIAGAVWALMMVKGLAPHPTVQLGTCLTPAAGPTGNISTPLIKSYLASWMGLEVSAFMDRDEATHDAIPIELLYRAVVGSELPSHIDVATLARNFRLPCRNGFTLTRYIRGLSGGSDRFITNVMASAVGALSLVSRLAFRADDALAEPISEAMGGESLADILTDYLMGSGIPCPDLFEEARGQGLFPDVVDLSLIDRDNFRAQMWTWAVSGAPFLARDLGSIKVGT